MRNRVVFLLAVALVVIAWKLATVGVTHIAVFIFFILIVGALFVLRSKSPTDDGLERPRENGPEPFEKWVPRIKGDKED